MAVTATTKKEPITMTPAEKRKAYRDEKVMIQLPKDNQNYKDDVTVCINGRIWQIQRGVQIAVPRRVANVLRDSSHQEMIAMDMAANHGERHLGDL